MSDSESQCITLKFIVVGASVAGLTCASALAKAGHDVIVLEMNDRLEKTSRDGGLRVPPNMARLMRHAYPGMDALLEEKGSRCAGLEFRSAETSRLMGLMTFDPQVMSDLGSDYCMIPHYDLCCLLRKQCEELNVRFRYHFKVASVETSAEDGPAVVVSTGGERVEGDIIVGADGRNSVVRDFIASQDNLGSDDEDEDADGDVHLPPIREIASTCISVPISDMLDHDDLAPLVAASAAFTIWMGDGYSLMGGRHGNLYVLGLSKTTAPSQHDEDKDWSEHMPLQALKPATAEYAPLLRKLLDLSDRAHPTIQVVSHLDSFVDVHCKAVVIGDAAHAAPINGTYNAALAVEDAFTLGHLFTRITSRSHISSLFSGYNEIRFNRTKSTERSEIQGLLSNTLPPGPQRDMRDHGFRKTLAIANAPDEHAEELAAIWTSWIVLFNYDAKDAVDEWWLDWGRHNQVD